MAKKFDESESKILLSNPSVSYGGIEENTQHVSQALESPLSYKARWRSIRVLYLTMLFSSAQFAIVLSSLWPYLQKERLEFPKSQSYPDGMVNTPQLHRSMWKNKSEWQVDSTVTTTFLGWTNSGFSLCQMLGSLLFGIWCDHRPFVEPLLFSLLLMSSGSVLYGYAEGFYAEGTKMILSARLLLGFSAGNIAACRTILTKSTTLNERATAFGNLAIWQAVGFIFGPAMQVAVVPIGGKGIYIDKLKLALDIYTAPGFLGLIMVIVNFIAILFWFREFHVESIEDESKIKINICNNQSKKPDKTAVLVCIAVFFVYLTVFALNETIIAPLVMDEFAWTDTQTVFYGGMILTVSGFMAVLSFQIVKYVSNKYGDRIIIATGLFIMLLGFITYLPWGNSYPKLQTFEKIPGQNATKTTTGCPPKYHWCTTTPKLYLPQFLVAAGLVGIGYPVGFLAVNTMYSKLLGPENQGRYMAIISAVGSFARVIGPLMVTEAYARLGPRWTFLSVDVLLTLAMLLLGCYYDRIISFREYRKRRQAVIS